MLACLHANMPGWRLASSSVTDVWIHIAAIRAPLAPLLRMPVNCVAAMQTASRCGPCKAGDR